MRTQRLQRIVICAVILSLFLFVFTLGKTTETDRGERMKIAKPTKAVDDAMGFLDQGKLIHPVFNDGRLATWDYRLEVPAAFYKGWSYVPDLFVNIGVPEDSTWTPKIWNNVIGDSVFMGPSVSETNVGDDWGPKAHSLGELHSGDVKVDDVLAGTAIGSMPVMATSTLRGSWPVDAAKSEEQGWKELGFDDGRFWPGPWAVDPNTGQELVATFTSDKDVFFSFNDYDYDDLGERYAERDVMPDQGYALGVQVDVAGFSYGRSYAEDFIFFPVKIINRSNEVDPRGIGYDYHDMYAGLYCDTDVPEYTPDEMVNARWDWMGFIQSETVPHPQYPERDTTYNYNLAYTYDFRWGEEDWTRPDQEGDVPTDVPAWKVHVALKLLETPKAPAGGVDLDDDGIIDVEEGEELGLTDWHWFNWEERPGVLTPTEQEAEQYMLMSGDYASASPLQLQHYFHPDPEGVVNPHLDSPESIREDFPEGLDCVYIMSTGPFNLDVGDTATIAFCMLMGDDLEDMKFNARTAQLMYNLNYLGADPPKPPKVTAVAGDGYVTLYWDGEESENSTDIMTGYQDFEGYKIYRTTSDPANNEWGDIITDGDGNEVGFKPLAQFDLADGYRGLDPQHPHLQLGSDSGLQHEWTDNDVKNGVTYWYSVTAYDRGIVTEDTLYNPDAWASLNYLECAKGASPQAAPNLVEVIPGSPPSGYEESTVSQTAEPLEGTIGNGMISFYIVDPFAVTGHTYILSFDDTTSADTLFFHIYDVDSGYTIIERADETSGEEGPLFDGIRVTIEKWDALAFWPDSSGWITAEGNDTTNYIYSFSPFLAPTSSDYELRFTSRDSVIAEGDTIKVGGSTSNNNIWAPFEIWNVTTDTTANFNLQDNDWSGDWSSGDNIQFIEPAPPYPNPTFTWTLTMLADTLDLDTIWTHIDTTIGGIDTTIAVVDSLIQVDILPQTRDILKISTQKPFIGGDAFRIVTTAYSTKTSGAGLLDNVKVVPNPYVVSAEWERGVWTRELHFTNLPRECDITIFTLTGEHVVTLHHDHDGGDPFGWHPWNMLTKTRREIAYGLYIYVIQIPNGDKKMGKFAVIK